MAARFILDKFRNRQFHFTLENDAGEPLITSDVFVFKVSCLQSIDAVRSSASKDYNYQSGISTDNKYFFVLRGINNEIIATSEMFLTPSERQRAIETVKREAASAVVIDHTIEKA